ncbi:hypothetical protein LCGC14_3169120 [marine sediment metagenome]|uniref:Uncharacterized protein n=1 Tax=marine sediment metagenome TaxID=412755 RepID=A0A0F8VES8_9ZZZZ
MAQLKLSVKIDPRDYIHLMDEQTTPMQFSRTLRKHLKYIGSEIGPFTYSLAAFWDAQKLSKYRDELPGEPFENGDEL